jgi:hypothetical protein
MEVPGGFQKPIGTDNFGTENSVFQHIDMNPSCTEMFLCGPNESQFTFQAALT